jgi:DNA invertase Pin-like site-specific DNA recombinase
VVEILTRLRRIAAKRSELLEERDRLIVEAKDAGVPVSHIAEAAGLSRVHTHKIINDNQH